jgi:hypothetical protein
MGNCCGASMKKAYTLQRHTGIHTPTDPRLTEVRATSADNSTISLKTEELRDKGGLTHSRSEERVYQGRRTSREKRGSLKEETGRKIERTKRSTVNIKGRSQLLRSLAAGSELIPCRVERTPRKLEKVEVSKLEYKEIEAEIIDQFIKTTDLKLHQS